MTALSRHVSAKHAFQPAFLLAADWRPLVLDIMPTSLPVRRQGFGRLQVAQRAKMPAENFRAVVSRADRTPRKEVPDRFAHPASARTIRALLSFGRVNASKRPTRTSMGERRLHVRAIHRPRIPPADNAGRSRHPSVPVRWPRWCCGHAHLLQAETRRAALSAGWRPAHRNHKIE